MSEPTQRELLYTLIWDNTPPGFRDFDCEVLIDALAPFVERAKQEVGEGIAAAILGHLHVDEHYACDVCETVIQCATIARNFGGTK